MSLGQQGDVFPRSESIESLPKIARLWVLNLMPNDRQCCSQADLTKTPEQGWLIGGQIKAVESALSLCLMAASRAGASRIVADKCCDLHFGRLSCGESESAQLTFKRWVALKPLDQLFDRCWPRHQPARRRISQLGEQRGLKLILIAAHDQQHLNPVAVVLPQLLEQQQPWVAVAVPVPCWPAVAGSPLTSWLKAAASTADLSCVSHGRSSFSYSGWETDAKRDALLGQRAIQAPELVEI